MKPTSRNNGHLRSDDGHTHRQTDSKWPNENVHWNVEKRGFRPSQQQIQFRQWLNREGAFLYLWGFLSMLLFFFISFQLRILLKQNTALLSTVRPCVCVCHGCDISDIYEGINAMLIIRGPIKPYTFWIKSILAIFLAKTRLDKTIFSALTNLTIDFDFEK